MRTGARRALFKARLITSAAGLPDPAEWQAETGSILFSTRRSRMPNLWKVPISPRDWNASGSAVRLTLGSGTDDYPTSAGARIAFAGLTLRSNIWSIHNGGLKPLTDGSTLRYMPSISAGGDFLVFLQRDGVMALDLRSGAERELLAENEPVWARLTPDGSRVFFGLDNKTFCSMPRTGGPALRHLDAIEKPWDVSPDGTQALAMTASAPRGVLLVDLRTGRRATFLSHPSWNLYWAAFSVDGEWVAFTAKTGPESSRVFAVPFHNGVPPGPSEWLPVTEGVSADTAPRWSPDGRRLYFFSDRDGFRCIWFVRFENGRPSVPSPLRHFHEARQSLSNVSVSLLELAVSRDRVVFDLDQLAGNIWLAQ